MDTGRRRGADPPELAGGRAARRLVPGVAVLLLAASACAGPERSEPPVREDVYVEVMGRLAAVRIATDPGRVAPPMPKKRADSIRSELLDEYDIEPSDLKEFARVVGDEPARMRALWDRIAAVSDSLWSAGWPPVSGDRRVRGGRRSGPDSAGAGGLREGGRR